METSNPLVKTYPAWHKKSKWLFDPLTYRMLEKGFWYAYSVAAIKGRPQVWVINAGEREQFEREHPAARNVSAGMMRFLRSCQKPRAG